MLTTVYGPVFYAHKYEFWQELQQIGSKVCLPKKQGGMSVLNLEFMIIALLSKWMHRYLKDNEKGYWQDYIYFVYGRRTTGRGGAGDVK